MDGRRVDKVLVTPLKSESGPDSLMNDESR